MQVICPILILCPGRFQLVSNQLFDPDFGLWLPSINNQKCMHINPASGEFLGFLRFFWQNGDVGHALTPFIP